MTTHKENFVNAFMEYDKFVRENPCQFDGCAELWSKFEFAAVSYARELIKDTSTE